MGEFICVQLAIVFKLAEKVRSNMIFSLLVLTVGLAVAQDTYSCPDGWMKEEDRSGCRCFLFGPDEVVTRSTADLICAGHSGSWVAELDHPGINYWLKAQVLSQIPVGERASFWMGGRTSGYHSDHQPGTWTWDHMNETIQWFDWHDGEPNNFGHNENCLALREYHDPFFPIFRDYFWNDMNCDSAHHYICENRCAEF